MVEDSGDEDYSFPAAGVTKQSPTSQTERTRRSRAPDTPSTTGDARASPTPATKELTAPVEAASASVGSALRRNPDGSVAVRKVLPKRNKSSKVNKLHPRLLLANLRVTISLGVGNERQKDRLPLVSDPRILSTVRIRRTIPQMTAGTTRKRKLGCSAMGSRAKGM